MSSIDSPTLHLDIRARRLEPRLARCALAAGAVAPWLLPPSTVAWTAYASVTIALVLVAGLRLVGWFGPRRLTAVSWSSDGRWRLTQADERACEAELHSGTRVFPWGVWLQWRVAGDFVRRRSMLLTTGDSAELRRLIVRLRIEGGRPAAAVAP